MLVWIKANLFAYLVCEGPEIKQQICYLGQQISLPRYIPISFSPAQLSCFTINTLVVYNRLLYTMKENLKSSTKTEAARNRNELVSLRPEQSRASALT